MGIAGVPRSGCESAMKVSGPQNPHHHHAGVGDADDDLGVELPHARFRDKCAEGGMASFSSSSCVVEQSGGQKGIIALLLGQQEEVLREIRDQKKVPIALKLLCR